ncbi:MAG TPA: CheR family methyltransferase, partial [Myxococcales bacterium]|nr:CheR family methyltransferase [Myxococcales bacterium]
MSDAPDQDVLRELGRIAGRLTGFRLDAVSEEALIRFLAQERRQGRTDQDLLAAFRASDRAAEERLITEVMVAETFFFRHPDHFEVLLHEVLPELLARERAPRLWSAGCASGEETYSLAACVLAAGRERARDVLVLGTDLSVARLEQARRGEYRNWSIRDAGPLLVPVVDVYPEHFRVRDDVRALARFQAHSLMEPPPAPGLFDVIFCRNVLVYLDAAAAKVVRAHLCAALRPGGYLFLGPLEGETPEPWLWPVSGRLDVLRRPDGAVLDLRAPTPR